MDPYEVRQGFGKVAVRQVGQETTSPSMIDVGSFLPSGIARPPKQTAMTPDEAVGKQVRTAGNPVLIACREPGAGMRHDLGARLPVLRCECFDLCRQLLWGDLLQLQHIAQLARSGGARNSIQPSELLDHAGVNGAADIAGFDQPVRLEQRSHTVS